MTPSSPSRGTPDPDEGTGTSSTASELGRYGGHGITIALSTALFGWLGVQADERLGTDPLFVLLGVFVGFGAGFYSMYRELTSNGTSDEARPGNDGEA
ncbi:MAG: AtpZ/AtpI family protein [Gemmatimonadota bacterium]|nr:AtpZ/AtpI family protein [Gemmatimonadota bacterium]